MNRPALVLILSLSLLALPLLASSEEGKGSSAHFDWVGFLGKLLNSVILFGGLFLLLRKPLFAALSQQGLAIRQDIEEREQKIQENAQELEVIRERLGRIENELEAIKGAAAESGRQEMEGLKQLGKEETAKILSRTESEINARIESAVKKLKARIAEMTIAHFTKDLEKNLDSRMHRKLIDQGIEGVANLDERK